MEGAYNKHIAHLFCCKVIIYSIIIQNEKNIHTHYLLSVTFS